MVNSENFTKYRQPLFPSTAEGKTWMVSMIGFFVQLSQDVVYPYEHKPLDNLDILPS